MWHSRFLEMDGDGQKGGDYSKTQSQSSDFVVVASAFTRQGPEVQILSHLPLNPLKSFD
jgi:hypothetical protein